MNAKIIELDQMPDGGSILAHMTGQRTVRNVFVNGKHLGGNDDTQASCRSGALSQMLQADS